LKGERPVVAEAVAMLFHTAELALTNTPLEVVPSGIMTEETVSDGIVACILSGNGMLGGCDVAAM
jgi:hypothetical protein